ncbi:ragulator complex protein LAMTOR1 [Trichonephila clavipes]|nr:ragulator complex protein LAMTOR1 [Trichonephila clavipes]
MGCCFSCFNGSDNKSQSGEPNERTTLLGNPVSNNIGRPLFSQDFSDVVSGQLGDEQAALNKILHQTAMIRAREISERLGLEWFPGEGANSTPTTSVKSELPIEHGCDITDIIDVSAIPTHLEQKDYIDRVKLYQKRLASLSLRQPAIEKSLLKDLPLPEKILSENSLLLADIRMIDEAFNEACIARRSIEVEPRGDLVSKFGVS